jgi:Cytochrome b5-like Heme/Steroid binding domain
MLLPRKTSIAAHVMLTLAAPYLLEQCVPLSALQYIDLHPGGEAMLRKAGRDSTAGFSGNQHPARVWDMIDEFYVGDLLSLEDKKSE